MRKEECRMEFRGIRRKGWGEIRPFIIIADLCKSLVGEMFVVEVGVFIKELKAESS